MRIELTEMTLLDEHTVCTFTELAEQSGLAETELIELIECGAIPPLDSSTTDHAFAGGAVILARTALRLRDDFELEPRGIALALTLLERIRGLETALRELRARLPASSL